MTLISAHEFYKLAKWSFCPYYTICLEPDLIQENDIVFLNLDFFKQFMNILNYKPIKHKFILIIHNSYHTFTNEHFEKLYFLTNHIYTINTNVIHPNVSCIPIGFLDNTYNTYNSHNILDDILKKGCEKTILLYSNFYINKNKLKRIDCLNSFINKKWLYKDQFIPIQDYYRKIYRSKYVLCPEGITMNTHRLYLCIYFNSIPIIKKTEWLNPLFLSLPIIIITDWNEITEHFLEDNYEFLYKKIIQWKETNDWTNAKFWLK